MVTLLPHDLDEIVRRALSEDVGHGDITTAATVDPGLEGVARISAKQSDIVFCGGPVMVRVFELAGASARVEMLSSEGAELKAGDCVAIIRGKVAGLLTGERTALNFVQLMSGIATASRSFVRAVEGTKARIVDTRKTHPGLRALEKYAVRVGGASNHRFGLDDGVLIKENHIAAAGSLRQAVLLARRRVPHTVRIQVECETLAQVEEALAAGADALLLDNMSVESVRQARAMVGSSTLIEVSGGITLENVREYAQAGADLISVGAITHSPRAADLSMRLECLR